MNVNMYIYTFFHVIYVHMCIYIYVYIIYVYIKMYLFSAHHQQQYRFSSVRSS